MSISTKSIEDLYQQIGQSVVDSIDDDWDEAWIRAMVEDDHGTISGRYKRHVSDEPRYFRPKPGIFMVFKDIRDRLKITNQPPWKVARFWIRRDGDFRMEFEHDDATRWRE